MFSESGLYIGSIHQASDRFCAASAVKEGGVIGVFNRGVNALWFNGSNSNAVERMHEIKGEGRQGRPVALTIGFDKFVSMIDKQFLAMGVRDFLGSEDLKRSLGSLCFIRAPIARNFCETVPKHSLSFDENGRVWVQTWDAFGHKPTVFLLKTIENLGIEYPAVTSMNISGNSEIVDQEEGEKFCRERSMPVYLRDEKANPYVLGSYTIITLSDRGVELTRDGNVPGRIIQRIFNLPLLEEMSRKSHYPQLDFPENLLEGLSSRGMRMAVLLYLKGRSPQEINRTLLRFAKISSF